MLKQKKRLEKVMDRKLGLCEFLELKTQEDQRSEKSSKSSESIENQVKIDVSDTDESEDEGKPLTTETGFLDALKV